ncbi:hypothetical protein CesoFtcFv8_026894 [Champsocephalus esox]|uniref:Uncharacterized protein n=1 Tax=Champsocephalus esox TaxID=159716 RepID=A0AAN8GA06_9TELE|nr:hypothetical protein CesoFtcFv8_026894 [Champsocephalus esox]
MHLGISLYHVLVASLARGTDVCGRPGLSSVSYIRLSGDLCHCDKLKCSDWWIAVNLLFEKVFAGVVTVILAGLAFGVNHDARLRQERRQQAHAVNSKEAVYKPTQTSALIRHSCSETAS